MEGRGNLSLNAALDLMYPDPSSGSVEVDEESKKKQQGKKALEGILCTKSLSTDSNDVADAAQAAYYLGLFVLQENPLSVKPKKLGIIENLTNFVSGLSEGKFGKFGEFVFKDYYEEAIERFKQAIELGGDFLYGDAVFLLALLYKQQNKNDLSNAYLLWAAYSGNAKAQEAWIEEVKETQEAPPKELKNVPVLSLEKKKDVDASPPLRQLISSIRPKRRFYLAVRRMIAHTRTIARFKSNRLNQSLQDLLEETGSIQVPNLVFNERVNTVEDTLDRAIKEKLIELSPPLPRSRKKGGMLVPNPLRGSYLKDILEASTTKDQKALHTVLNDSSDISQITKIMGKIGVKYYYLAAWWLKSPPPAQLLGSGSPSEASVGRTEKEKKLHGKATLSQIEALELCRIGEKYYREGIRKELKEQGSGINSISAAINCFKAAAANDGCRDAAFNLGVVYENAWILSGQPQDKLTSLETAIHYYGKASDAGCAEASYVLSEIYASHYQRIKEVEFAKTAFEYLEKAREQGYTGSAAGTLQVIPANQVRIISQQEKEKKEEEKEGDKGFETQEAPSPSPKTDDHTKDLARQIVAERKQISIADGKEQAEDEHSPYLFPLSHHHIRNKEIPSDEDEEELVLSLFASRPVGIFSGWSKDQKEQKHVKLGDYIRHAQGSSCFYSGNSSYQSIQSLFQKLGISTDIRKKEKKNTSEELPDADEVKGELLSKWFAKKQEIKEVNADERKVVEEIFNKRTSSWGISGWSESNKKYGLVKNICGLSLGQATSPAYDIKLF